MFKFYLVLSFVNFIVFSSLISSKPRISQPRTKICRKIFLGGLYCSLAVFLVSTSCDWITYSVRSWWRHWLAQFSFFPTHWVRDMIILVKFIDVLDGYISRCCNLIFFPDKEHKILGIFQCTGTNVFFFSSSVISAKLSPASTTYAQVATWLRFFFPGHSQWELLGHALFIPYYRL